MPGNCVLCGKDFQLEYSDPGNDATCPYCGHLTRLSAELLDRFKSLLEVRQQVFLEEITSSLELNAVGIDSLETVEFIMGLEEEFGVSIPEDETSKIQTVGDAIRYILEQPRRQTGM
ncbi:MAG: phosphopantetheine-binding protein [Pirellulaceae bacterium]|nr:phosphopantetheine-binding protein [Pirellulaceae bacterium]